MSTTYYEWARAEPRALARLVGVDLPPSLRLPDSVNRLDLLHEEGTVGVVRAIYQLLRLQQIDYDLEPFTPRSATVQRIRTPAAIVNERRGTCLDLAMLFCGLCLENDLVPLLVVVDGHAFAAVSREQARRDDPTQRPQYLAFDRGLLSDLDALRSLAARDYLVVECTGFAQSRSLSSQFPEGRGRDDKGCMPFKRALDAGQEQVAQHTYDARVGAAGPDQRAFLYALDIADLQDNQGFAPDDGSNKDGESPASETSGDTIDAQGSQGFVNRPTGPVSQNFGTQTNVNTGGGTYMGGDQFNLSGSFQGSNITIKSTLSNVTQSINTMPAARDEDKAQLIQLIGELNALLQRVSTTKQADAETVATFAQHYVETASKTQPNQPMVKSYGEMLKKAAENIEGALPIVLNIGAVIAKLMM